MWYYVYRITDKRNKKHYYGSRGSDLPPKLDLGHVYYSSSSNKDFIEAQLVRRHDFKYKIIFICDSREKAFKLEYKLHRKFKTTSHPAFHNGFQGVCVPKPKRSRHPLKFILPTKIIPQYSKFKHFENILERKSRPKKERLKPESPL